MFENEEEDALYEEYTADGTEESYLTWLSKNLVQVKKEFAEIKQIYESLLEFMDSKVRDNEYQLEYLKDRLGHEDFAFLDIASVIKMRDSYTLENSVIRQLTNYVKSLETMHEQKPDSSG